MLQVEQLIGSLLAQAASSRYYLPTVQHLLSTSEGAEVYLRNPQEYGLPAGELSCCQSVRVCCMTQQGLLKQVDASKRPATTPMSVCACVSGAGGSVTLASAAEHARQYNETVIGYRTASGKMVLAPEASHVIPLEDDCRLVSFAADFTVSKAKSA